MSGRAATVAKRDQVIDATLRLLRGSGQAGASLNRTLAQSGAPKGSLYHYFPGGKTELVTAALLRFSDGFARLLESHFGKSASFEASWNAFVQSMIKGLRQSDFTLGCPVASTLLGLEPDETEVRGICNDALTRWTNALAAGLRDLPARRRKPFAEGLFSAIEGALILSRAQRRETPLQRVRDFGLAAYAHERGQKKAP